MGTQDKAIVDKLLTNVSQMIKPVGFISEMILPVINVVQYSGKIGRYGNSHMRIETTISGGRNEFPLIETNTRTSDSYSLATHGLKDILTPEDFANVEKPFDARSDSVEDLTTRLFLGKEKGLADALTSTAIITQNVTLSGTSQYSDYANSDPLGDFSTARSTIRSAVGTVPDTAVMDWATADMLRYHPDLLDNLGFKDSRPGGLNTDELAKAMGVRRVLIAEAVYNSAKKGQADVIAPVWGKHIVFGVMPEKPSKQQVTVGYRVQKSGEQPRQVFKNGMIQPPNSELIQVQDIYQQLITKAAAAYLIEDAIA